MLCCWKSQICTRLLMASALLLALVCSEAAQAQLKRGFERVAPARASGEERNRQTDLRVMEVQFKRPRMIWVHVADPSDPQKTQRKEIWYIMYRAMTRPTPARADLTDTRPINALDKPLKPDMFAPEFQLITYDNPRNPIPVETHMDQIIPEALEAIRVIEQRPASMFAKRKIEDSLSIIQPFPAPIPQDAPAEQQDWIYGVALFADVDPETDFFQVTMRGFSNAFELREGPDGEKQPWRKVIIQKYTRRGDRFDPTQKEFEFDGNPVWTYQPDETDWKNWTPPKKLVSNES